MALAGLPHDLLAEAGEHLIQRRVAAGAAAIDRLCIIATPLPRATPGMGRMAGLLAQWVDLGVQDVTALDETVARFSGIDMRELPSADYVALALARGLLFFLRGDAPQALDQFNLVIAADAILDFHLASVARHYKARCLRRMGSYRDARVVAEDAHRLAIASDLPMTAAVIAIMVAWLRHEETGGADEALSLLVEAERVLGKTDDFTSRSFLCAARARILRRHNEGAAAVTSLRESVALIRQSPRPHPNLPRLLVNLAFGLRLEGLNKTKQAEDLRAKGAESKALLNAMADAERLFDEIQKDGIPGNDEIRLAKYLKTPVVRDFVTFVGQLPRSAKALRLSNRLLTEASAYRDEASAYLKDACGLYRAQGNTRGLATALLYGGFVELDAGRTEEALQAAAAAFEIGAEKRDPFLRARSRILQCMATLELAEQAESDPINRSALVSRARSFSADAVEDANSTQSPRLLARAKTWHGRSLLAGENPQTIEARTCYEEARELLANAGKDYAWSELGWLQERLAAICDTPEISRRIDWLLHQQQGLRLIGEEIKPMIYRRQVLALGGNKTKAQETLKIKNATRGRLDAALRALCPACEQAKARAARKKRSGA